MANGNLPDGWAITTLGESTKPMQKRVNPRDYPELPYIGMGMANFFLLGAMVIVELIDAHDGFDIITEKISYQSHNNYSSGTSYQQPS